MTVAPAADWITRLGLRAACQHDPRDRECNPGVDYDSAFSTTDFEHEMPHLWVFGACAAVRWRIQLPGS